MALNPETEFIGKISPADADYPYGKARDVTVSGDGTGTPFNANLLNDQFGFQQALLSDAGITPTGIPEKIGGSQYLESLKVINGINLDSITDLAGLIGIKNGQQASMRGWHADSSKGGGLFHWNSSKLRSEHNGGTIISPTVPDVSASNISDYLTATGTGVDPSSASTGVWIRTGFTALMPNMFGAVWDGVTDSTASIQRCFDVAEPSGNDTNGGTPFTTVDFGVGHFIISSTINVPRGILIKGNNGKTTTSTTIEQVTPTAHIFDLLGYKFNADANRTADQVIQGIKFTSDGFGIRARQGDYPLETVSYGSIRITGCHFLNVLLDYALDIEYIECIDSNTFDHCPHGHAKVTAISTCTGNTFYQGIKGGVVLDATSTIPMTFTGNNFTGNGGFSGVSSPYYSAIAIEDGVVSSNVTVTGNTFSKTTVGYFGIHAGAGAILDKWSVCGNVFTGLLGEAFKAQAIRNCTICGNVMSGIDGALTSNIINITAWSVDSVIANNTFSDNGGTFDIKIVGGSVSLRNRISGNNAIASRVSIATQDSFLDGIDYIANANGEYYKYADGTLVCKFIKKYLAGTITANFDLDVTFPHSFINDDYHIATEFNTSNATESAKITYNSSAEQSRAERTVTGTRIFIGVSAAVSGSSEVAYIATGRWK